MQQWMCEHILGIKPATENEKLSGTPFHGGPDARVTILVKEIHQHLGSAS
ncbi:hypothetical protein HNR57_007019 [Streptomyces paradoxus]|uniref:Uncharacterized protein n=1 Tax=Streptomyces paradoxus TaxID=66375 RepID=A0A7W9THX8_9ACTN|nr:hypothetical protein [Streptomyces paradoxus]